MLRFFIILFIITYTIFGYADSSFSGDVTKIIDGDTIYVTIKTNNLRKKIRLVGIDAPEIDQPYGIDSKLALEEYLLNKHVTILNYGTDKYNRILGKVVFNNKDINSLMIKYGHAWLYRKYQDSLNRHDQAYYLELENNARDERLGIFSYPGFIEPWMWRSKKRIN
mgnify:FL=1|jgi:micrococcal nuclease